MARVSEAYTAAHGHPMDHDGMVGQESRRRRWSLSLRVAMAALVVLVLVVAGVVLTDLARSTGAPAPLGQADPSATTQEASAPTEPGGPSDAAGGRFSGSAAGDAPVDDAPAEGPAATTEMTVLVHVVGQVVSPGVVEVAQGARLHEAVAAAGGFTTEADTSAVNLAREVVDGEQVYVPAPGEDVARAADPAPGQTAASPGQVGGQPGSGQQGQSGLVNINTADLTLLDSLPGIGPALAQRILDWRTDNGAFTSVDELTEVSGIGPAVMARLRDLVTV